MPELGSILGSAMSSIFGGGKSEQAQSGSSAPQTVINVANGGTVNIGGGGGEGKIQPEGIGNFMNKLG